MTRAERARQYFLEGYPCASAVLMAFAEGTGAPGDVLLALSRPMGGGMGRLRLTCGGVTGGVMALGLYCPDLEKSALYALVQEYARRMKERNGSILCGELLAGAGIKADRSPNAEARTEEYYKKRPCPELVYSAAEVLETLLREHGAM